MSPPDFCTYRRRAWSFQLCHLFGHSPGADLELIATIVLPQRPRRTPDPHIPNAPAPPCPAAAESALRGHLTSPIAHAQPKTTPATRLDDYSGTQTSTLERVRIGVGALDGAEKHRQGGAAGPCPLSLPIPPRPILKAQREISPLFNSRLFSAVTEDCLFLIMIWSVSVKT